MIPVEAWSGGIASAILIGAFAGLIPAVRASRMPPTAAAIADGMSGKRIRRYDCHRRRLHLVSEGNETKGAVMKVFVAGATGALGRALVPQLVARGHEVVGMTRSASKQDLVRSLGARPVVADALDPDAVAQAVASAEPEVIVHQLTALSGPMSIRDARHPDRSVGGDHDQPAAYRGDGPSLGRRPRRGGTALRGAELRGVPIRPHRRAGADRGRSPRSRPAGGAADGAGGATSIWRRR